MGLDMYLTAERYLSDFNPADKVAAQTIQSALQASFPPKIVSLEVAYWRKANHIHRWLVENCQEGRDECQKSDVSREQLQALYDLASRALAAPQTVGRAELPTQPGFFFGGTGYDDDYVDDLHDTCKQLERIFGIARIQGRKLCVLLSGQLVSTLESKGKNFLSRQITL